MYFNGPTDIYTHSYTHIHTHTYKKVGQEIRHLICELAK